MTEIYTADPGEHKQAAIPVDTGEVNYVKDYGDDANKKVGAIEPKKKLPEPHGIIKKGEISKTAEMLHETSGIDE